MRILVVAPGHSWSTADVYRGWVAGLRAAGAETIEYSLDRRLQSYAAAAEAGVFDESAVIPLAAAGIHERCFTVWPDWVLFISAHFIDPRVLDTIRARRIRVAVLHTESPWEDEAQLALAEHADLNLITDPTNLAAFQQVGPAAWCPHSYDPAVHHPGWSPVDVDVAWIGTAGVAFPSRTELLADVDWGDARVLLGGMWPGIESDHPLHRHLLHPDNPLRCVDNIDAATIYRGAAMSFHINRSAADGADASYRAGWAMAPRELELAATGCFFARHSPDNHGGEGDDVLWMLPRFTDPAELTEIVAHYLAHPDRRHQLAVEARRAVAGRTFTAHAAQLLTQLDAAPQIPIHQPT